MKLSLCTIVKNDELLIKKMLDSVIGVVDEIVIADTGSTDKTVDVIETFQKDHPDLVKLVHFEWVNDFAAARNFTLEHATGDWVLVLDADEFLDNQEKKGLRRFLEDTDAEGVFVKQRNYTGSMKQLTIVMDIDVCRVFRSGYQYDGALHEQIAHAISEAGGTFKNYNLHLHHVGYTDEYVQLKQKQKRNIEILYEELKVIPKREKVKRWFTQNNLVVEQINQGQLDEALQTTTLMLSEMKQLSPKRRPNFMLRVYKFHIYCLMNLGRADEALTATKEAVKYYPNFTDLYMQQAEIYFDKQDYTSMIEAAKISRKLGDVKFNFVEYTEGNGTYLAAKYIAYAWLHLGDNLTAREWFAKSYEENTEQVGIIPWIVLLTPEQSVLHALERVIQTPQRYDEFLQNYTYLGFDDALTFIEKAEKKWGITNGTKRARFGYAIRHGQTPALSDNPTDEERVRQGLWYYEQGEKAQAQTLWSEAGSMGDYYKEITNRTPDLTWQMRNVYMDIWAAKAINFLKDYGAYIDDIDHHFRVMMHTDLLEAFTVKSFLTTKHDSLEAAEWKAQVYLSQGDWGAAEQQLEECYLPNGERSVRGYIIASDVYKDDQQNILRLARKRYPESKMLSYIWMNYFAPSLVPQGVVM